LAKKTIKEKYLPFYIDTAKTPASAASAASAATEA
jgi:hypothetical protein